MILHAGNGLLLTQKADVPMKERLFLSHVTIKYPSEADKWKEVTKKYKDELLAETAIVDMDDLSIDSIKKLDSIKVRVATRINELPMSVKESIAYTDYFPKWEDGKSMVVGYKVSYEGKLYEVIQEHTSQSDWTPNVAISLFKVVQVEAEGTEEDVIQWEQGMVLEFGKYYVDNGVKYECVRDSINPLYYSLDVLVGNYVNVVEDV